MAGEEIRQDNRTVEQIVDGMSLFDDDLMSMVFDGNIEATELLLKIILKKDDIQVVSVVGQRELQSPVVGGRDIRLDILAKDSTGKHYNVEVQHGIPIYTINRHFEEIDEAFDDGSHIVYVNGSYKGDDTVGRLMHDFGCKEAKDMYYPELAKGVRHFKEEGGRERMCEAVEKYGDRRAESARLNILLENVRNLMESMKWSAEQAMSAMKVSEADKVLLLKEL